MRARANWWRQIPVEASGCGADWPRGDGGEGGGAPRSEAMVHGCGRFLTVFLVVEIEGFDCYQWRTESCENSHMITVNPRRVSTTSVIVTGGNINKTHHNERKVNSLK